MAESNIGLAEKLRTWMRRKGKQSFKSATLISSFKKKGYAAQTIKWAFRTFLRRGEVKKLQDGLFVYDRAYRAPVLKSPKSDRIHKAIYVINRVFGGADILTLSDLPKASSSLIVQTLRNLTRTGYLRQVGMKGNAKLYRLIERERFKLELLKN